VDIQLAIHHCPGSFSDRWISYCDRHQIAYKLVNCFDSDIIERLKSVDGLLWHWNHQDPKGQLMARSVLTTAEMLGLVVFPSSPTGWHFDDKIAQKYLLEAVGAPLAPTHIFYDLKEARKWIRHASFPKVFKLRKGAGSENVRLVSEAKEADALARQAFTEGFRSVPRYWNDASRRYRVARSRNDLVAVLKRLPKTLKTIRALDRALDREKGYVYFQDFMPGNNYDTRVTVIGDRGFAYIRKVRPNDFRASGSGNIDYDPRTIDLQCVRIAFETAKKIGSQSAAFDFVRTPEKRPVIVEVSYCYVAEFVHNCEGHWDPQLNWHAGHTWPEEAILADLITEVSDRDRRCSMMARAN